MSAAATTLSLSPTGNWQQEHRPLKRKLGPYLAPASQKESLTYPSPPMSRPPTPPKATHDLTAHPTRVASPFRPSGLSVSAPPPPSTSSRPVLLSPFHGPAAATPYFASSSRSSQYGNPTGPTGAQPLSIINEHPHARGARRPKSHVASACINCKRAHLSCDVQRPCGRCIATEKQDTCVDVQHKKRGRPRLREEGEGVEQVMRPETGGQPSGSTFTPPQTRPIAKARPRRSDSFRSHQSQASESSSGATLQPAFSHPVAPKAPAPYYETATALLDLNFTVLRANKPFEQIMLEGYGAKGRSMFDFAAPADGHSLFSIRDRLRAERQEREPAYLPPILGPGQYPVSGVADTDIERLVQGFSDETYMWTQSQPTAIKQTFPVRVRLAKANIYFAVITLPSFRPMEAPPTRSPLAPSHIPPYPAGSLTHTPEYYASPRPAASQSAPPQMPFPYPIGSGPTASPLPPRPLSQTYPQIRPSLGPPHQSASHLPFAEPSKDMTSPMRATQPPATQPAVPSNLQLPPLIASPAASVASGPSSAHVRTEGEGEDDQSDQPAPKRRRKMDIGDVLH